MIRWTFGFEEGHLAIEVKEEAEDARISAGLAYIDELLYVPGEGKDAYINLQRVKLVLREEVEDQIIPKSLSSDSIPDSINRENQPA